MPKLYKNLSPIGVFIPLRSTPCRSDPNAENENNLLPAKVTIGAPYVVVVEYTQFHGKAAGDPKTNWLGLIPSRSIMDQLEWVVLQSADNEPNGIYIYQGQDQDAVLVEET